MKLDIKCIGCYYKKRNWIISFHFYLKMRNRPGNESQRSAEMPIIYSRGTFLLR